MSPPITMPNSEGDIRSDLSTKAAIRWAWFFWVVLLVLPFLLLQLLVWHLLVTGEIARSNTDSNEWFVAALAYLVLIVPGSFFWRGYLFRDYWLNRPVTPRKYLVATIAVGLALGLGGTISMVGCLVTGSFMPNLIPALVALLLFALHWPRRRAING
jgi:hypothetical protein